MAKFAMRGGILIISLYPRDCVCQAGTLPDKLYIRNLCCTQMKVISRSYKVFCKYRFGLGFIFYEDIGYLIYILSIFRILIGYNIHFLERYRIGYNIPKIRILNKSGLYDAVR